MRRIPIENIQEGSKVGKSLYNSDGKILLREGADLNESKKERLKKLGYNSVYITDMLSTEPLEDMVNPEVRIDSIKNVRRVFDSFKIYLDRLNRPSASNMKEAKRIEYESVATISSSALDIVEDLLGRKKNVINIVDIKNTDGYLYQHSVNVAVLAVTFGMKIGYNLNQLKNLAIGGMLHDVGYNFLDYASINNDAALNEQTRKLIEDHPTKGYEYLKENIDINAHIRLMVYQHHEWLNGSGYPLGLKGDEISEYAKVIAIVDMYDALTSDRPFRKALDPQEANERMFEKEICKDYYTVSGRYSCETY